MGNATLGDKARDTVTGYEGTVTGISVYLSGSDRVCLERLGNEGPEQFWFDIARLEQLV